MPSILVCRGATVAANVSVAMREILVIDDVAPALASMSECGRTIMAAPAERLRQHVLAYAARRGWSVVRHGAFAEWARDLAGRASHPWLSLDPLFGSAYDTDDIHQARLSRQYDGGAAILRGPLMAGLDGLQDVAAELTGPVGVIDDAVASGRTLQAVLHLLGRAGAEVAHVIVCGSPRSARDLFQRKHPAVRWSEFIAGDWVVLHLRDGCPLLPYTGRATGERVALGDGEGSLERRVPTSAVPGHPWQVLCMNSAVRWAVSEAVADGCAYLGQHLGRTATVADLPLLGDHMSVTRGTKGVGVRSNGLGQPLRRCVGPVASASATVLRRN